MEYNLFMNQVLENCDDLFGIKGDLVLGNIETGAMILTPDFETYLDILRSVGQIQIKGKGKIYAILLMFYFILLVNTSYILAFEKLVHIRKMLVTRYKNFSQLEEIFNFLVDSTTTKLTQEEM
jgi:hypothetical protein